MPSHIFVQLGMWPEARGANEAAWASSSPGRRERPRPGRTARHAEPVLARLHPARRGEEAAATATLATLRETAVVRPTIEVRVFYYAQLAGSLLAETGGWSEAAALYDPVVPTGPVAAPGPVVPTGPVAPTRPTAPTATGADACHCGGTAAAPRAALEPSYLFGAVATRAYFQGMAAVHSRRPADAERWLRGLQEMTARAEATDVESMKVAVVHRQQLAAAVEAARPGGGAAALERALAVLEATAVLESQLPVGAESSASLRASCKATSCSPRGGRPRRAPRSPPRSSATRIAPAPSWAWRAPPGRAGDRAAAREACRQLASNWRHADARWPDLAEVRACAR